MKSRRVSYVVLVPFLVVGLAGWQLAAPDPIEAKASKVRPGMSRTEVHAILGDSSRVISNALSKSATEQWVTPRAVIAVNLDPDGKVTDMIIHREPLVTRIRARLGLPLDAEPPCAIALVS